MPMEKQEFGNAVLYCGDCLEIMPTLQNIDVVLTDPPYSSGGFQESGKQSGSIGTRQGHTIHADNLSTTGYRALIREMCRAAPMADEFFIFTDWKMWPVLLEAAELGGVKTRNMIVWDKMQMGMGMPWRNQHELIYYGKRSAAKINTGKHGNVRQEKRTNNTNHPTEKPVGLVEYLIANTATGSTICDPFMGSGTTGIACRNLKRQFIGIEIDPKHFDMACLRIEAAASQVSLFDKVAND